MIRVDNELEVFLIDFGSIRFLDNNFSNIAGTYGYICPIYYQKFQKNNNTDYIKEYDIFSFGKILEKIIKQYKDYPSVLEELILNCLDIEDIKKRPKIDEIINLLKINENNFNNNNNNSYIKKIRKEKLNSKN
jgi:hypothetical protein